MKWSLGSNLPGPRWEDVIQRAYLGFALRRATSHQHCVEVQALRWCDQVVETMAATGIPQWWAYTTVSELDA
jgi:hypothetical protein